MKNHLVLHGCGESVKATLESYWAKKLARLEKLLAPYRPDHQDVRLTVHRHEQNLQRAWYEGRAVIHLPTGTLVAEAGDKEPRAVLDRLTDTLAQEIKRHKEHVRKDYLFKRKKRARADLSAAGPLLGRDREVGRREDFFQLLRPLLGFLRDHTRRELRILELEGLLHRNEVNATDVLDEVLSRAWDRFPDRPKHVALDLWLTGLLHEVLSGWVKQEPRPHATLTERAQRGPEGAISLGEQEWWAALLGYDDAFTLEDLVPGSAGTEAWDELAAEEQRRQLLALVAELPTPQRQAFLLHALEAYDPAEIAMLQDRPESQVRADIEAARKALKERLVAKGQAAETDQPTAAATKGD